MNMVMCIDPWVGLKAGMCVRGGGSLLLVGVPGGRFALFRGGTKLHECKNFSEVWSFFFWGGGGGQIRRACCGSDRSRVVLVL